VGVLGYWGATARIAGAIIASGMIQVESNRQVVQHQDGGVVGEILAKDGDSVTAGDIVLRLDDTFLKSELAIVEGQLFELMARRARLEAERDELADFILPDSLLELRGEHTEVQSLFDGQYRLFMARRDTKAAELEQLAEQRGQLDDQIVGTQAELSATSIQAELILEELSDAQSLLEKGLIQASRVLELRREEANLQGLVGRLNANIAQLRGQKSSIHIQELGLSTTRREEAISALRDLQFRQSELAERRLTLRERLSRLDVRTPVTGTVFGSTVFALQSVLQPGAPLMFIVPQDQPLIVSARVESIHIDQVHVGQEANLRFAAFDQRLTPEVSGVVSKLSADVIMDEATGLSFYQAELIPNPDDLAKLRGQILLPGMPVEAFIATGERSPLNYLAKPLTDYFTRAFREN
jgi:HlyD family type I secretion membrane fusion protein